MSFTEKNKDKLILDQTVKLFEEIEKDLKLDKQIISNVNWWDLVRYPLFIDIKKKIGLQDPDKFSKILKLKKFIFIILRFLKSIFFIFSFKSAIWLKKNCFIIWGHSRRKFENGYYIDPYVDPFIELFPSDKDFAVIERDDGNGHYTPAKTSNLHYADQLLSLAFIFSCFKIVRIDNQQRLIISELEKLIFKKFSCKIDVTRFIKKKIKRWLGIYPLMCFFFKIKKPKLFFIVVSEEQEAIIAAAKFNKVLTLELQHGSPARGKINYDYSSGIKKTNFTDKFLSFGDYWTSDIKLPIKRSEIIPFGFPYLYKKVHSYSHIVKENRLVVISQNDNVSNLVNFAKKIKKNFSKKIIVEYRPHPVELYNDPPGYIQDLLECGVIVSEKHEDLYSIFARSRWQVGVYSTALYEGLYFDVACFILKLPGHEHMQRLVDLKLAKYISSTKDIDFNFKVNKKKLSKIFLKPKVTNIYEKFKLGS